MLCGPAKTAALGVSLVSSQYGAHNPKLGILLVPLVLYQAEQVMTANFLVTLMKKWIHYDDDKKKASDKESELSHRDTDEEDREEVEQERRLEQEDDEREGLEHAISRHNDEDTVSYSTDSNVKR